GIRDKLVTGVQTCALPICVFVSASAIGYYGDRGDETLTEESKPGGDFLAELVQEWEVEARKADALGIRVVLARFGVILAREGGEIGRASCRERVGEGVGGV